jgi:hypothetical protein
MKRNILNRIFFIFLFLALLTSCTNKHKSGQKMELKDLGISITIPTGWTKDDNQLCHKNKNLGMLMSEEMEYGTFKETADKMSKEFGSKILSQNSFEINSHKAIKTHFKALSGAHVLITYIDMGKQIAYVSYSVTSKELYNKYKKELETSLKTIKIE